MKSFRLAIVIAVVVSCFCRVSAAQNVYGSTTIDIDPSSGIVTATCETDLDGALDGNYYSQVTCSVTDQNGTVVASGSAADVDGDIGYAQAVLTFSGTPGSTYTATGFHHAYAVLVTLQFLKTVYEDPYNFSSFESGGIQEYPDYYDWYGPGPEEQTKIASIRLGETTATQIRYYTPTELSQLITSAQSLFSPHCDAVFTTVIGSSYTNVNFFESLRATSFIQYPPGAPNIPPTNGADAATLVSQPGRPIELFPNFYPTKYGFDFPAFQQFVLIHEGVHHYTGWYDFSSQGSPDFQTQFYTSGYRNTTGGSEDFTVWLNAGCPPAS
jgi:hypothetical protein